MTNEAVCLKKKKYIYMLYLKISLYKTVFFNHYNSNTQKPKRADSLGQGNFHLNP